MLFIATRKGLLVARKSQGRWRIEDVHFHGIPISNALAVDGIWLAAQDHGHWGQKLQRSTDEGQTWTEVPVHYPAGAELEPGKPASCEYIWEIAAGGGRIYLGTNPGGLFRSDDSGASFHFVQALWDHPTRPQWFGGGRDTPGIYSAVVDPNDPAHVLVGISCAGVFETRDDGATWAPRNTGLRANFLPNESAEVGQDPHLLVAAPSNFQVLWQQNHCGVYRSIDGAASWQERSQGDVDFGFPIAVHPTDPDIAWVVPAVSDERRQAIDGALQVCRTTDGGTSWRSLREGLPQEHCFDLVYRHAFALQGEGTLAMGSTTGNLWISEDGGDRWSPLSHTLAPIYAVRWG